MGLAFERARAMGEPLGACWEAAYQAAREHWTRQPAPEAEPAPEMERKLSVALNALQRIDRTRRTVVDQAALWDIAQEAIDQVTDVDGQLTQPAPELAAAKVVELGTAWRLLGEARELLNDIGVMAANAPGDGDSFAVCEEIAMRVAAAGVPDSAAAPDLNAFPWRQGRSQGRNLYARTGGDDWKADVMIGQLNTPELAAGAVRAHNAAMENL